MIRLSDKNLAQSLKKDGLKPMYYVTGNDEYLVDRCIAGIVKSAVGSDTDELYKFDTAKSTDEEIEQTVFTYSFSDKPRAVIFDACEPGSLGKARTELLTSIAADIPESTTLIFKQFIDDNRFSVSKKVEGFVSSCPNGVIVEAVAKKGYELENYIANLIKKHGCTAADAVSKDIAELCGDDLMLINNEAAKLAALSDYGEITSEHVKTICIRSAEAGVYDMIGKIERKDARGALLVLGDMLDNRTAPLMITAALNIAFINYYRARLAREKRYSDKKLIELFDYKPNDRKVSIAFERCPKFSIKQLERIIAILYELDTKLKSSTVDERVIIEYHIARLAFEAGAAK
ncbi:MAG: DNA polymerase III subunit delta [Oscillospiraceae bacterium]